MLPYPGDSFHGDSFHGDTHFGAKLCMLLRKEAGLEFERCDERVLKLSSPLPAKYDVQLYFCLTPPYQG
jgi:hypothetical protein